MTSGFYTPVQENQSVKESRLINDDCTSSGHWVKLAGTCYEITLTGSGIEWALREHVPAKQGLLYFYKEPKISKHHAEYMLFLIDILYFDNDRRLVNAYRNAPPCTGNPIICLAYPSSKPVSYALELNAGQIDRLNLKAGDELILGPSIPKIYEQFEIAAHKPHQIMIQSILMNEYMDDKQKRYWLDKLPLMGQEQIADLSDHLKELEEKKKYENYVRNKLPLRNAPQPECNYILHADSVIQGINRKINCHLYQLQCIDGPVTNNIESYASSLAISKIYTFNNISMEERGVSRLLQLLEQHVSQEKTCPLAY